MRYPVILIIIFLMSLMLPAMVYADDGFMLTITPAEGNPGDRIVIYVEVENAIGSEGGQFLLRFDPELLKPVDLVTDELIDEANNSLYMFNLEYLPGEIIFMWVTPEADIRHSGKLCEISFELLKEGITIIEFDEVVIVPETIALLAAKNGTIIIGESVISEDVETDDATNDEDLQINNEEYNGSGLMVDENIFNDDIAELVSEENVESVNYVYPVFIAALILVIGIMIIKKLKGKGSNQV